MHKILLTGGGTAGHVMPNIALMPELKSRGYDISYIGSLAGMEKDMIEKTGVPYYGISTGKLRRYFDLKNFTDPFRVIKGYFDARSVLKKIKPDVVFSKGGFVSVPVVIAASHLRIPVIIHESDMTPGLANKICLPYADRICCNFPETSASLPAEKAVLTGSPIRQELFSGEKEKALEFLSLPDDKPIIFVVGGSLGSVAVNNAVRSALPRLLEDHYVVHSCGKGHLDASLDELPGYRQYEFIGEELSHIMAAADIVISRAGANAICELLALQKPHILIPLPAGASRGDQILNSESFARQGFSVLIKEEDLSEDLLLESVKELEKNKASYVQNMKNSSQANAIAAIADIADELSGN